METILAASETLTSVVGTVFTLITGNPLLSVFCAGSLIGVGVAVYKRVKGAAR